MSSTAASAAPQVEEFDRNAMIMEYYPLVKSIAYRLVSRFPSNVDVEDLINVGTLGLIDAIDRFSPERQESFKAYAELRIRGEIIDELRHLDWVPRSVRKRVQKVEKQQQELQAALGRSPTEQEVADSMGIGLKEYQNLLKSMVLLSVVSLEDLGVQEDNKRDILQVLRGDSEDPGHIFEAKSATNKLKQAIEALPEKQRMVISMYYYEDLTLKQIGKILNVTESRVSQIHSQAVDKLKIKLKKLSYFG